MNQGTLRATQEYILKNAFQKFYFEKQIQVLNFIKDEYPQ